jgi:integrase
MLYQALSTTKVVSVELSTFRTRADAMASLHQDPRTDNWLIYFRYGGRQFTKSCETQKQTAAKAIEARVEETIRLLKSGRIEMPEDAEPGIFIMSDGKLLDKPKLSAPKKDPRLGQVCESYLSDQMAKAESTVEGERIHIAHLKKMLGEATEIHTLTLANMQDYVKTRSKQKHRGRFITGKTIRKELGSFRQIWTWARHQGIVAASCPIYGTNSERKWAVSIPLDKEREEFQTWTDIERKINRGGLSKEQIKELWDVLFLDETQVAALLEHVKKHARYPFIYPMFVFAAYTGARRAEIRRSQIEDFDFATGQVKIRERKRRKDRASTFRFVLMHPRLREVMQDWFAAHPGGMYTITAPLRMGGRSPHANFGELGPMEAHHHFKQPLKTSKWHVIRGFHVLRHSFGSNLARSGKVSRDVIGTWMGHSTDEMKEHYHHLFPQDGMSQIEVLK